MNNLKTERVIAAIVDAIILSMISGVLSIVPIVLEIIDNTSNFVFVIQVIINFISYVVAAFVYYSLVPYIAKGKTIGKAIFGLRTVNTSYENPKFWQYLTRNVFLVEGIVAFLLSFLAITKFFGVQFYVIVFLLTVIITVIKIIIFVQIVTEKKPLHDAIGHTTVVHKTFNPDLEDQLTYQRIKDWADVDADEYDIKEVKKDDVDNKAVDDWDF